MNRKANRINDLPTPPPRQCWVCVPPVIALKTRGPRTAFLADYFVKDAFRNELRRVLNRGEAVNALKRAIYTGRVSPAQAKRAEEMQAVADALSLLANIIMAWNTTQMQAVLDRWANRRQVIPAELTGKIAPTRLQGINLRGVFRFPVERYASEILPSQTTPKTGTGG